MVAFRSVAIHLDVDGKLTRTTTSSSYAIWPTYSLFKQVAPYLICKAWSIRDTMGWRTQTIGCCLAK